VPFTSHGAALFWLKSRPPFAPNHAETQFGAPQEFLPTASSRQKGCDWK
jgi:hypothetical protein